MRLDSKSGFLANPFRDLATANEIHLQFLEARSHKFIGAGETFHAPQRPVFRKLRSRYENA